MGVLRNINFLRRIAKIPCTEPDMWILAETFFKAAPPALLQLFVPGCSEILQARIGIDPFGGVFNPILKGPPGPQGIGRRGRHGKAIGAQIGGLVKGLPLGGNQFLWRIGFFHVQAALWWWQVADVTTEFLANWQSMVYEEEGCNLPDLTGYADLIPPFAYTEGTHIMGMRVGSRPGVFDVSPSAITFAPGVSGTIGWWVNWQEFNHPEIPAGPVSSYLVNVETQEQYAFSETNDPDNQNGNTTGGFYRYRGQGSTGITRFRVMLDVHPTLLATQAVQGQLRVSVSGFPHSSAFGCNLK